MTITPQMIENILKTKGWSAFENLTEKTAEDQARINEQAEAEAHLVNAALSTPEGEKLLHWLLSKTLLRGPSEQELGAQTAESYAIAKARREGQNSIVFMILQALEKAREGQK